MTQQSNSYSNLDFALLILRVTLGIFFIVAGLTQVASWAANYRDTFSGFAILPAAAPSFIGVLFPWVEIILGTLLIAGLATSIVAAVITLLTFVFTIITGFIEGASIAKEILFIVVALVLMLLGGGDISLDGQIKKKKA